MKVHLFWTVQNMQTLEFRNHESSMGNTLLQNIAAVCLQNTVLPTSSQQAIWEIFSSWKLQEKFRPESKYPLLHYEWDLITQLIIQKNRSPSQRDYSLRIRWEDGRRARQWPTLLTKINLFFLENFKARRDIRSL